MTYAGKTHTSSNLMWHRLETSTSRVEHELIENSKRALATATDPLEKLRLGCLSKGAAGIMAFGRIFRKMHDDGTHRQHKHFTKEEFFQAIKETGLAREITEQEAEDLFARFDPENTGSILVDDFIRALRPPMSEMRRSIVEKAFAKLDRSGEGEISVADLRSAFSCTSSPSYMNGDDSEAFTMDKFLHIFGETEGEGKINLEEFMSYYSGISVSMDNDCFFDLTMRQAFKL